MAIETGCFKILVSIFFSANTLNMNMIINAIINGSAGKESEAPISVSFRSTERGVAITHNRNKISIDKNAIAIIATIMGVK
jgi:hypothetical protein